MTTLPKIHADMTAADIEGILLDILRRHRPGECDDRGCNGHLEVYAREIQKDIIEPLFAARASEGLIKPLDDMGYDVPFVSAWNRAVAGEPEPWDCRQLAAAFVSAATKNTHGSVQALIKALLNGKMDRIDDALLRNLPEILRGDMAVRLEGRSLMSRYDRTNLVLEIGSGENRLMMKDRGEVVPLSPPIPLKHKFKFEVPPGQGQLIGIMSFHNGRDHDVGDKLWQAWRDTLSANENLKSVGRHRFETDIGLTIHSMYAIKELGVVDVIMRQDEWVSVHQTAEGAILYRGKVDGCTHAVDEGNLLIATVDTWLGIFGKSGLSAEQVYQHLEALIAEKSAVTMSFPPNSAALANVDPGTLGAREFREFEGTEDLKISEATPLFAVGTFEMPEMMSYRERKERGDFNRENTPELPEI